MIKTMSFAAVHFSVAFAVVWVMTGDWRIGGLTALVEPCVNTVAYTSKRFGSGVTTANP